MKIPTQYPPKGTPRRKRYMRLFKVISRDGCWCCVCGETKPSKLTLDHLISRSNGGTNRLNNLQILCKKCHTYKDGKNIRKPKLWFLE